MKCGYHLTEQGKHNNCGEPVVLVHNFKGRLAYFLCQEYFDKNIVDPATWVKEYNTVGGARAFLTMGKGLSLSKLIFGDPDEKSE